MAQEPQTNPVNTPQQAPSAPTRRRAATGTRAPQGPRTIYVVLQVMDENGQPTAFDKRRIKLLTIDSSADAMLSVAEADENPNAFFIRGKIAQRKRTAQAGATTQPGAVTAKAA